MCASVLLRLESLGLQVLCISVITGILYNFIIMHVYHNIAMVLQGQRCGRWCRRGRAGILWPWTGYRWLTNHHPVQWHHAKGSIHCHLLYQSRWGIIIFWSPSVCLYHLEWKNLFLDILHMLFCLHILLINIFIFLSNNLCMP